MTMKQAFLCAWALCLVTGVGWTKGKDASPEGALHLVKDGRPNATIVVADAAMKCVNGFDTVADAALLLQRFIEKSTGAKLPIQPESEAPTGGLVILVGRTKLGDSRGISAQGLPAEGFQIQAFEGGVAIVGEITKGAARPIKGRPDAREVDRGTLFGVYRFLEDRLGIRWYFAPEELGTVIPKAASLAVPSGYSLSGQPYFPVRLGGISHWTQPVAQAWHPVLRFGASRGMVANHSMEGWPALYGKSHPEYFGLRADGSRAITYQTAPAGQNQSYVCLSEPGVLRQHVENVDRYYATGDATPWRGSAQPSGDGIPFGVSDTRAICVCPACKAQTDETRGRFGKGSDLVFEFVRKYGEEVKPRHPQAVINVLAYDWYELAPRPIRELPDNISITLCLIPTVVQMNHPGLRHKVRGLIDEWFARVRRNPEHLVIWDYFCYPNCFFVAPTEFPHVLREHVNFIKDKSLGIFNNGFNPSKGESAPLCLTYRMVWLMHRLLWNPDLDVDQARTDWCRDLFGPAAGEMESFYRLLEDRWEKTVWSSEPTAGYVGEYSLYAETYPADAVGALEALLRKALAKTEKGGLHRQRLEWFRDQAFQPFFNGAKTYHAAVGEAPSLQASRATVPPFKDHRPDPAFWKTVPSLATVERVFGKPASEKCAIQVAYDPDKLYVLARFSLPAPDGKAAPSDPAADQAVFQFGMAGGSPAGGSPAGGSVHAKATGRENPAVEKDDLFIIHLKPEKAAGYLELAINPNGAFSSQTEVIKTRGFFPTHGPVKWDTREVFVSAGQGEGAWAVMVAVPWRDLPGLGQTSPRRLQAQFLRWNVKDAHNFTCWSPTLSTWDYPLARFGWLVFENGAVREKTAAIRARTDQAVCIAATGPKPDQPDRVAEPRREEDGALIVGQRDLNRKSWLEYRAVLMFDLAGLIPDNLARVRLRAKLINAVGEEPFDDVVVDHITPAAEVPVSEDYSSPALTKTVGVLFNAGRFKDGEGTPRARLVGKRYSLDVTECVKADLAAGRKTSGFRLRIPSGCTAEDGQIHYLVFQGAKAHGPADAPCLEYLIEKP